VKERTDCRWITWIEATKQTGQRELSYMPYVTLGTQGVCCRDI